MPDRDAHEARLHAALALILRQYGELARLNPGRLPWKQFERELAEALVPELLAAHVESARALAGGLKFELADERAAQAAQKWAERYAAALAAEVVGNTRKRLEHDREQEDAAQLAAALILLFGDDRAWRIGVTETTRSITQGEKFAVRAYERSTGEELIAIWETAEDERVCKICRPLDGKRPEYWQRFVPAGPPAHVNCRCSLKYQVARLARAA